MATNPANGLTGPERRSTRIDRAISLTVMGVDAWRGPYTETVSTVNVSAHGCKYESAHQVLSDSLVILELKDGGQNGAQSVRGRVRYVKRPTAAGKLFQTAIELEDPGNVWGVADPPKDWLPFCVPKTVELDTAKPKPFAVPRPDPAPAATAAEKPVTRMREQEPVVSLPPSMSAITQVMGGFQQQMEKMLSEAAAVAVHDRTKAAYDEMRARLREEVSLLVAESVKTNVDAAVEESVKQLNATTSESASALRAEWSQQLETELKQAREQLQASAREMQEATDALSVSSLDRLKHAMEASRRDAVDRIISRLKEQSAPLLEHAQKTLGDLSKATQEWTSILTCSLSESTERIKQFHAEIEKQFEKVMRDRLEAARAEFERAARGVTIEALNDLRGLSQKHEAELKSRLQKELDPMVEASLQELREKAMQTSQHFAGELDDYSRSHLEFVGGALSDLAKGLGKKVKE